MTMYNMLHGIHPTAGVVMSILELTPEECGRFRDAFITAEGEFAIYTRNGGGNREEYQGVIDTLAEHPNYLRDEDDEFDSTYCTIFFRVPEEHQESIVAYLEEVEKQGAQHLLKTPAERFQDTIEALKTEG